MGDVFGSEVRLKERSEHSGRRGVGPPRALRVMRPHLIQPVGGDRRRLSPPSPRWEARPLSKHFPLVLDAPRFPTEQVDGCELEPLIELVLQRATGPASLDKEWNGNDDHADEERQDVGAANRFG